MTKSNEPFLKKGRKNSSRFCPQHSSHLYLSSDKSSGVGGIQTITTHGIFQRWNEIIPRIQQKITEGEEGRDGEREDATAMYGGE